MEKKVYTAEEKKAYYMGLGAAMAGGRFEHIKRTMNTMTPVVRESYRNGLDDGYLRLNKSKKIVERRKKIKGR